MRVGFIEGHGCQMVLLDFSDLDDTNSTLAQMEEARRFFQLQPRRGDLLTLVDLGGVRYNDQIVRAFQQLMRHDEPWERAVAVCGLSQLGRIAFRPVNVLAGSRMRMFDTRAEGMDWLSSRAQRAA
jgi:hypothetical protein